MAEKTKTLIKDFTTGPIFGPLIAFSVPFMLSNALQVLYSTVDMIIVGHYMGEIGITAVGNAAKLFVFFTMVSIGLSMSGQIYVAQLIGQGRRKELNRAIGTLFTFLLAFGAVMTVVGLTCAKMMLGAIKVPDDAYAGALSYLLICSAGLVFSYGYNMVSAVLRGMGDSKRPFLFVAIASVTNLVLDVLFIAGFHWGTFGAGLATILGQALSFVFSWIYLYRRREEFGFDFKPASFKPDAGVFRAYLRLGIPFAVRFAIINVTMLYVIRLVNAWGASNGLENVASAVFTVGVQMDDIVTKITQGVMQATTGMVGQNYGARKFDRIRKIVIDSWLFSLGFYVIYTLFLLLKTDSMFRMFNVTDPKALELASVFALNIVWQFPGLVIMRGTNGFINGIGNAKLSLIFGLLDGVVLRLGCSWFFGSYLGQGFAGYVLGYAIACYGMGIPSLIYLFFCPWQKRKAVTA